MTTFKELTGLTRSEWDDTISAELSQAGIACIRIPYCDSPQYVGTASLRGQLGEWVFSRHETGYLFWGDVPLSMATRVATDPACRQGSLPSQWCHIPDEGLDAMAAHHDHINSHRTWLTPDGYCHMHDDGSYSKGYKEALQHDYCGKLRFVTDPSQGASPFVLTYTFFTQTALTRFVEISNEERVGYRYWR